MTRVVTRRLRAVANLSLFLAVLGLIFVAAAAATSESWFTGNLSSGEGNASSDAHSITYVQGNTSSGAALCVGTEDGFAGYFSDSSGGYCQYSGYQAAAGYFSGSCCYHALVENRGPANHANINSATHFDY